MSRLLTPTAIADKNAIASESPWLWLYLIQVSEPQCYRLVRNLESLSWRDQTWTPANVRHGAMNEDAQASIVSTTLTIANVTREVLAMVDAAAGLPDQAVEIYLVPRNDLASGQAVTSERYSVIRVSANESAVSIELGQSNAYRTKVPGRGISRSHCAFKFRGEECGYIGALPTCDFTLSGENGCIAHGTEGGGDSPDHPARFGGEPQTPRTSGIGVKN